MQWRLEPGGRRLPEDQLQPWELRQCPTLLQESEWKHCLAHHLKTGGLCARRAQEAPAARQGEYVNESNKVLCFSKCSEWSVLFQSCIVDYTCDIEYTEDRSLEIGLLGVQLTPVVICWAWVSLRTCWYDNHFMSSALLHGWGPF